MIGAAAIYQKSAKGAEAIAQRSTALGPKLRSVLIFVDGKRSVEELARLIQGLGDPHELLGQLLEHGFIEPTAAASATPGAAAAPAAPRGPASAPAPLADTALRVPLKDAQRFAARRLTDLLGPTAETLCMKIEATRTAEEFAAAIQRAEAVLRQYGGAKMADTFAADMRSQRPG